MAQELHSSSELIQLGWTPSAIRGAVRRGELLRVRRGAYVYASADEPLPHPLTLIQAEAPNLGDGLVLSHLSAAALWNVPLWGVVPDGRVWVTRRDTTRGNIRGPVHALNC